MVLQPELVMRFYMESGRHIPSEPEKSGPAPIYYPNSCAATETWRAAYARMFAKDQALSVPLFSFFLFIRSVRKV